MNSFLDLFQGFAVMAASDPVVIAVRITLVLLGFALVWLGRKGILEPLLMIPACFLGGGIFCLACDLIARTAFAPAAVSISSVTAVFGAPVVIYMMLHRKGAQ